MHAELNLYYLIDSKITGKTIVNIKKKQLTNAFSKREK